MSIVVQTFRTGACVALAGGLFLNTPAFGQMHDQRAKDAFDLWFSFCASTFGRSDKAEHAFGDKTLTSQRIPAAMLPRSRQGQIGWAVQSPGGARVLIEFEPTGLCSVQVAAADRDELLGLFTAAIGSASQATGPTVTTMPERSWTESGVDLTFRAWSIHFNTSNTTFIAAITAGSSPLGPRQHLMTFSPAP